MPLVLVSQPKDVFLGTDRIEAFGGLATLPGVGQQKDYLNANS